VVDLAERIEKLKAKEEQMNKQIEKLTNDLATKKLKLRDLRKQIRANERLAKKMSPAKT
jgi:prefoldin subunit 5